MRPRRVLLVTCLVIAAGYAGTIAWLGRENGWPSRCHGSVGNGWLEGGRRLSYAGDNYTAYSLFGYALGRTFMHGAVRDAVQDAYADLYRKRPDLRFKYGEASWPWGGWLWPHRTHRNGTAVDFFVPVRADDGSVDVLHTSPLNLFGYAASFDRSGRSGSQQIDFEAMATHLLTLSQAARARGAPIRRVIFDVNLQPRLFATPAGGQLRGQIAFNTAQAWVRHDEHYHVEFGASCQ